VATKGKITENHHPPTFYARGEPPTEENIKPSHEKEKK